MGKIDTVVYLRKLGVHITNARKLVLLTFLQNRVALTQGQILRITNDTIDRVTIYRTLDLFVCKGIIHIIPSMDNITRYALLRSNKDAGYYNNHLHFMCDNCGKTICLNTIPVPMMPLPNGYSIKETEVIVKGTCKNCN